LQLSCRSYWLTSVLRENLALKFERVETADFRGFQRFLPSVHQANEPVDDDCPQTLSAANWRLTHGFMAGQPLQL